MQVPPALAAPRAPSDGLSALTAGLASRWSEAGAWSGVNVERESRVEADERKRRREERQPDASQLPTPTEIVQQRERRIESNSRTFGRIESRSLAESEAAAKAQSFRTALRDAHESPATAARAAPSPGEPKTAGESPPATQQRAANDHADGAAPAARPDAGRSHTDPNLTGSRPAAQTTGAAAKSASATGSQPASSTVTAGAPPAPPRVVVQPALRSAVGAAPNPAGASTSVANRGNGPEAGAAARTTAAQPIVRGAASDKAGAMRPAKPADLAPPKANIEQIVRLVRRSLDGQRQVTTVHLKPAELGSLRIRLDLDKDVLALRIEPQTEAAHRLLREEAESLRQALAAGGIQLAKLEIRPPAPSDGGQAWTPTPDSGGQAPAREEPHAGAGGSGGGDGGSTERRSKEAAPEVGVVEWRVDGPQWVAEARVNCWA
ncbi:MAG: flagellar hook-length control protein FliK [Phycisphaerae bacterium]|nr:flagellar hook-length control protein FliK [Phycisphaerae bacterium]MCZ2399942.1 flagellar hook-length control protein FliK [Phycisphaerae bacterium]